MFLYFLFFKENRHFVITLVFLKHLPKNKPNFIKSVSAVIYLTYKVLLFFFKLYLCVYIMYKQDTTDLILTSKSALPYIRVYPKHLNSNVPNHYIFEKVKPN